MKTTKKLGIWMDHSIAYLMEFTSKHFETETIESKFTNKVKNKSLAKGESLMHNKEKQQLLDYYKKIGEVIKNYKRIILFGPTDAKVELFDILSEDVRFLKIKIEIKNTDKMTENQQHAFVKEYFSRA
jgi:stalled ribosome rescue protein Dom34